MRGLCVAALLVVTLIQPFPFARADSVQPVLRWTGHAPISIVGDANFTAANGVAGGTGSLSNPYVISGWNVDANFSVGILVRNTSASFVIRDVFVHGIDVNLDGILLDNVTHARITNVTILARYHGLSVRNSDSVNVSANAVTGDPAVLFGGTSNATAYGNDIVSELIGTGIVLFSSTRVSLIGNSIHHCGFGIRAFSSTNSTILSNTISGAFYASVGLEDSLSFVVRANVMSPYGFTGPSGIEINGMVAGFADSHTISPDNTVGGLPVLYLPDCRNVTIDRIHLGQLILADCQGAVVTNVTLGSSEWSFYSVLTIIDSWDWTFTRDTFLRVGVYKLGFHATPEGQIYLNNIYGIGLNGNMLGAALTAPYPLGGNYWNGYTGEDQCSGPAQNVCPDPDGFGDTPEVAGVSGGYAWIGVDSLPRMTPLDLENQPATPSLIVTPAAGTPSTSFLFNASGSKDSQDPSSALQVRWDWNDDGVWDTNWSTNKTVTHAFASPGTYTVGLEVRDSEGWLSITSVQVTVGPTPLAEVLAANWWAIALVVAVVAGVVVVFRRWRGRRSSPQSDIPAEEEDVL